MPEHDVTSEWNDETIGRDEWIDSICDRYEDLWLGGKSVAAADFLRAEGIDPDHAAPTLLHELERLEVNSDRPDATRTAPVSPESGGDAGIRPGVILAGRYKLIEPIGKGGMGDVWMARQLAPVRRVVRIAAQPRREQPALRTRWTDRAMTATG